MKTMEHRVSQAQIDELLDYLATHRVLLKSVGMAPKTKEANERLWIELASKLNAHIDGASKTSKQWKRYWTDLKFKTKNRVARRRQEACGPSGEPASNFELSDTDKKILAIIEEGAMKGNAPSVAGASEVESCTSSNTSNFSGETQEIVLEYLDPECDNIIAVSPLPAPNSPQGIAVSGLVSETKTPPRTTHGRKRQKLEEDWDKEMESRRLSVETKMAEADLEMAKAFRSQAEAAVVLAEAMRIQADALRIQAEAMRVLSVAVNKLIELMLRQ